MPSFREVQYYLAGLWLLIRMDSRGFRYLDLTNRGFNRSFWAVFWCLPPIGIKWVYFQNEILAATPKTELNLDFYFRLAIIEGASWIGPLLICALLLFAMKAEQRFLPFVIVFNWIEVPTSYLFGLLVAALAFAERLESIIFILLSTLFLFSIFVHVRLMRMVLGPQYRLIIALTLTLFLMPSFIMNNLRFFLDLPRL